MAVLAHFQMLMVPAGADPCADYTPSLVVGIDISSTDFGSLIDGIEVCREVV